ncbi:MAG TPA: ABC transporter substrate-binding protein, partial [Acidimicrobiales bacterium]|nr:ABC transporter substrate-binding protein [Acidimicrobiales bacterium]
RGSGQAATIGVPGSSHLPITPARAAAQQRKTDFGPNCDPATGRIKVPTVYAPPCVPPFSGDNGGATAPGVTATTITVAIYRAAPDLLQAGLLASGGASDSSQDSATTLENYVKYFQAHYETYGRTVKLVTVDASGGSSDDAAAKADAIRVATEIKAFASFGGPAETDAYARELAARHVLCIGCSTGLSDATIRSLAPYIWGLPPSPEQQNLLTAQYIGKRLKGATASHAGQALQHKQRVFGLLAYDTPAGAFGPVRDHLAATLASYGVPLAAVGTYTLDVSQAQELARTLITKMKGAGVTSIILQTDPFGPVFLTKEATSQGYFPEWIVTGTVLTDTSVFARLYDQSQWQHAFGLSELPGRVKEVDIEPYRIYQWQFAAAPPASSTYDLIYENPLIFFTAVHLAGPDLTAASFRDALFSYPVSGGGPTNATLSFGRHGLWPADDYLGFDDATQIWWDPSAIGPDEIGRTGGHGLYRYSDGGRRYLPGQLPDGPDVAFQAAGTVTIFDPPPDAPPNYPSPHG